MGTSATLAGHGPSPQSDLVTPALRLAAIVCLCAATNAAAQTAPGAAVEVVQSKSGPIRVERLAKLSEPWGMTFLADGRLLITEKPGRLRVYSDGRLSEPVAGVPAVAYRAQGGLLDVEIDPDFARNGLVYLYFVEAAEQQPKDAQDPGDPRFGEFNDKADTTLKGGAVARGRLEGEALRDVKVIWRQVPKTIGRGHFGGRLVFGADGKLLITSGDRMRFDPAQDLATNLGKVVRINPDGSVPDDNPFAKKQGARAEVWSVGHRNPLGAAIEPASKRLWIHEMAPAHGDELNIPEPGKNFGWPLVSNGDNYDGSVIPDHPTRPEFVAPMYYWHPAISPSGLIFYKGNRFPEWLGNALLGGLSSEVLLRLTLDGNRVKSEERIGLNRRIRDVIEAADGAVLLLTDGKEGELLRLTPSPR
jgi:glucose/arabinose dehydrogenase